MKNCDLGLENTALSQHFQDLGHSFTLNGQTLSRLNNQLLTYSRNKSHLANAVDYDELNVLKNNIFN